jgi:hypothetical protein
MLPSLKAARPMASVVLNKTPTSNIFRNAKCV